MCVVCVHVCVLYVFMYVCCICVHVCCMCSCMCVHVYILYVSCMCVVCEVCTRKSIVTM